MTSESPRVRRVRRELARADYRLVKQRRLDRTAYDYGKFRVFDRQGEPGGR